MSEVYLYILSRHGTNNYFAVVVHHPKRCTRSASGFAKSITQGPANLNRKSSLKQMSVSAINSQKNGSKKEKPAPPPWDNPRMCLPWHILLYRQKSTYQLLEVPAPGAAGAMFLIICTNNCAYLTISTTGSCVVGRRRPVSFRAVLEATQGQMDGFFGQLSYKCHLEEAASVED